MGSRLGSVTARHSSSRRQPNFAVLNRGRHLYSAGRPSRWALAHISSFFGSSSELLVLLFTENFSMNDLVTVWANAQRDGRPTEYRWHPLFNAAKFG